MTDEAQEDTVAAEAEPVADTVEYIEFVGQQPHGVEFYGANGTHGVSRKHLREYHDVSTPKDLEWKRGTNGRFLVPVADMSPEAAEVLANDPLFRRVTL